jgi:general secretion pathway protein D
MTSIPKQWHTPLLALAFLSGHAAHAADIMGPTTATPVASTLATNKPEPRKSLDQSILKKKVSLEFRDANVRAVLDVLSQSTGVNFVFDHDIKPDLKTSIYATKATLQEVLGLILQTSQLRYKVINEHSLLIYPDTPDKAKQYEELTIRSFVLVSADMKKIQDMIKTILNPKYMYVDEHNRVLTIRDQPDVLEAASRLIDTYDVSDPEVSLEVKILEVGTNKLSNLGITLPSQIGISPIGLSSTANTMTAGDFRHLNGERISFSGINPALTLLLQNTNGDAKLLANPTIRVKSHEKAKILVGDKVPVITTTSNQLSSSISESVSYLDVGLKLEVEPEVQIDDQVLITLNLEVSNIVQQIKSASGLLTYQIGTRNSTTTLQLKDGETQIMAGLIQDNHRSASTKIPLLGEIPYLGRLFSSNSKDNSKTEIILSITPRIVKRNTDRLNHIEPFKSGTQQHLTLESDPITPSANFSETSQADTFNNASKPTVTDDSASKTAIINSRPFDLMVPQITSSHDVINLGLSSNAPITKDTQIRLAFDKSIFNLLSVSPLPGANNFFSYATDSEGIVFSITQDITAPSQLALISLKPINDLIHPEKVILQPLAGLATDGIVEKILEVKP